MKDKIMVLIVFAILIVFGMLLSNLGKLAMTGYVVFEPDTIDEHTETNVVNNYSEEIIEDLVTEELVTDLVIEDPEELNESIPNNPILINETINQSNNQSEETDDEEIGEEIDEVIDELDNYLDDSIDEQILNESLDKSDSDTNESDSGTNVPDSNQSTIPNQSTINESNQDIPEDTVYVNYTEIDDSKIDVIITLKPEKTEVEKEVIETFEFEATKEIAPETLEPKKVRKWLILSEELPPTEATFEQKEKIQKEVQEKVLKETQENIKEAQSDLANSLDSDIKENSIEIEHNYTSIGLVHAKVTPEELEKLNNNPEIENIEKSKTYSIVLDASIPYINADSVWGTKVNGINITGAGETICIIDTGIDYRHDSLGNCTQAEFLAGDCTKVLSGYDYVNNDPNPMDDHSHGTHCAGIASSTHTTYRGVAFDANLVALKACNSGGGCGDSDILAGIDWCITNASIFNISVISMSLGDDSFHNSYCSGSIFNTPVRTAVENGITVAIAAGNVPAGATGVAEPACVENATVVGGLRDSDNAVFYKRGALMDLFAPGIGIYAPVLNEGFGTKSGTSMATPHVAGAIAVMQQYNKLINNASLDPYNIEDLFEETGVMVYDSGLGYSKPRLDLQAAIESVLVINESDNSTENTDAKIKFSNTTAFTNITKCVNIKRNAVSVNAKKCPELNKSATLTFKSQIYKTNPVILMDGQICPAEICSFVSYSQNNAIFTVGHFTNYSTTTNSRLEIWDENDVLGGNQNKTTGEIIRFYANYTNKTSNNPINNNSENGNCNITINSTQYVMSFNSSGQQYWSYSNIFSSSANYSWNVSCNATGYEPLNVSDNIEVITNTPPNQTKPILTSTFGTNRSNENLTVYNQSTNDVNNQVVSNIINWYVDGVINNQLKNLTRIDSTNISRGEGWQACVTPNDGVENGTTNCSNNITVLNSPATQSTPILNSSNGTNTPNENLSVYNKSTYDADGDSVDNIIDWYVNNAVRQEFKNFTTINSSNTSSGQDWKACIIPYDGYENGTRLCSNTIAIPSENNNGGSSGGGGGGGSKETCFDGKRNQGETGIDCGGICAACPSCFDGKQNCHDNKCEEGVDCGGPCAANCAPAPRCDDGIMNGYETGIDCGGYCGACEAEIKTEQSIAKPPIVKETKKELPLGLTAQSAEEKEKKGLLEELEDINIVGRAFLAKQANMIMMIVIIAMILILSLLFRPISYRKPRAAPLEQKELPKSNKSKLQNITETDKTIKELDTRLKKL
ncbi:S8 family serine peptidase [Nanoarchaeota archaeon]